MRTSPNFKRPRIGIVAHGVHDEGGQERAVAELIRRIHGDFELVVFSSELATDLRRLVTWKRIPVLRRPAPARFALFYLLAGARVATARLDVVHSLGAVVPQRLDLITVQCCHTAFRQATRGGHDGTPLLRRLNTAIAQSLWVLAERWSFRPTRVRLLVAVSAGAARDLTSRYPATPSLTIPNGVDSTRFRPDRTVRGEVRSALGVPDDRIVSLFVGGDWYRKGLPVAIEAFARARRELGVSAGELWVVGHGDERRLGALARSLGIETQVRFLGFRRTTERFYQAADLFVLPTTYESFSLAALEAAASGLPLVVPSVNGVDELVREGGGLIVEPDRAPVADALAQLIASPRLRSQLGQGARRRALEFTWDRAADEVARVYNGVLGAVW